MEFDDEFKEECCEKEVCSCDVKVSEESKTKKRGLLKQCDEINKQNDVSFISDFEYGLNNGKEMTSDEKFYFDKQFEPSMKMVFRHKKTIIDNVSELLFDINMVKSEPNKKIKDLDSLKTINKLFKLGNLNDICIKRFSKHKLDPKYTEIHKKLRLGFSRDEKNKSDNETFFKTGYLSLDFDHVGCDYSNFYSEIINVIYSNLKHYFMNLCDTLPSYECTKNTKVVGLLFSGGKDSTCRLLELLEQGENVVPIVNTFNSYDSTSLLLRDITIIYNLSKIYETKKLKGTLYKPKFLTYLSWKFDHDYLGLVQQPYNIMSLTILGSAFLNNCKRIECCLINGDMGVSYISEMTKLYKTAMKFNYNIANGDIKVIPPLVFQYIKLIKDDIIDNLDIKLDNILDDKELFTLIPTCQNISIHSIKLAFINNKYWLYVSLENCGNCKYCKNYNNNNDYSTLCIPLAETEPINKNDIVLSQDQIRNINSNFSNIFKAY